MKKKTFPKRIKEALKILGPGLVTGASDDDPSGIATYSQVGAKFGLSPLWMAWLTFPLMASIQKMCARIGIVTNNGLPLERQCSRMVHIYHNDARSNNPCVLTVTWLDQPGQGEENVYYERFNMVLACVCTKTVIQVITFLVDNSSALY